jgi:flagellar biosynthetic protein FliR
MTQYEAILQHIPPAMLVIFRIGGLMIFAPVFGSPVVPVRIKVFLSFLLGLAIYPLLSAQQIVAAPARLDLWLLAPAVALEMAIGLLVGFLASLPLIAAQTGGLLMGQQMGLGFARFYNPGIDDEGDVIGQVFFFMTLASFLIIGGHEAMLLAVLHSFELIPLGTFTAGADVVDLLAGVLLAAFELALRVATPVLALVFLESLVMGYMAKTVPQLNILSLGFPLRILASLALITLGLVVIDDVLMSGVDSMLDDLFAWLTIQGNTP